jgi:hypothetical protein
MAPSGHLNDDPAMYIARARGARRPNTRLSLAAGMLIAVLLLGLAAALAYLAIATPFAERFMPQPQASTVAVIAGAVGWALLLTAPAIAAIAGIAWLAHVAERGLTIGKRPHPITDLSRILGPAYATASEIRLPDGRTVAGVIVGPHGVAVLDVLPPREFVRDRAGAWERRIDKDRWVPEENPLERAARTADGVRHWLGAGDRDFVVKVHVAVIATDRSVPRTPSCAVITPDQIPAYLASLPAQRSFTPERRAHIFELLRSAA